MKKHKLKTLSNSPNEAPGNNRRRNKNEMQRRKEKMHNLMFNLNAKHKRVSKTSNSEDFATTPNTFEITYSPTAAETTKRSKYIIKSTMIKTKPHIKLVKTGITKQVKESSILTPTNTTTKDKEHNQDPNKMTVHQVFINIKNHWEGHDTKAIKTNKKQTYITTNTAKEQTIAAKKTQQVVKIPELINNNVVGY